MPLTRMAPPAGSGLTGRWTLKARSDWVLLGPIVAQSTGTRWWVPPPGLAPEWGPGNPCLDQAKGLLSFSCPYRSCESLFVWQLPQTAKLLCGFIHTDNFQGLEGLQTAFTSLHVLYFSLGCLWWSTVPVLVFLFGVCIYVLMCPWF